MESVVEDIKEEKPDIEMLEAKSVIKSEDATLENLVEGVFDADMALKQCGCEKYEMVEKLSVKDRSIKKLSSDFFEKLRNLEELDISDNELSVIPISGAHKSLKTLNCAKNNFKSVNELAFFSELHHLNIFGNSLIQVSDRYKLVSILTKLKSLDGKDVDLMREAIGRLNALLAGKLRELFRSSDVHKIYLNMDFNDEDMLQKFEGKVLNLAKKRIMCGPEVLKGYREYKLEAMVKLDMPDFISSQKEKLNFQDNRQPELGEKRPKEEIDNVDGVENVVEKRMKSAECQVNEVEDEKDDKKYQLTHLLQTHSLNNDPKDWETKVWMCEFEPDPENPGDTTNICATCGGDSVCFVDCETGLVMKKYKQPQEVFYCLAWTLVDKRDDSTGMVRKTSMLAVAGLHGDIKLIDPQQLICYQEVSHHKKAIDALLFHPLNSTWLFSGSEDKTIILWDIAVPSSVTVRKLLTLKAGNIVRQIVVVPHGKVLVGSCDDGCYVWNIDKVDEHQARSAVFKFIFPGDRRLPVDSVSCVSNNLVATKRIEEGQIQLWYSGSEFTENDVTISHVLSWRVTDTPFLKFNFIPDSNILLAGDDEGFVWLYDLSKVASQQPNVEERDRTPLQLRHSKCLRCTNPLARLFNHVTAGQGMKFIVAVSDTNVVAIWRRLPAK